MKQYIVFLEREDGYFDDPKIYCLDKIDLKNFCQNLEAEGSDYCIYELGKRIGLYNISLERKKYENHMHQNSESEETDLRANEESLHND